MIEFSLRPTNRSSRSRLFRASTALTIAGLLMQPGTGLRAQTAAPPPPPDAASTDQAAGDPPARVGRLAAIMGTVSFHAGGQSEWQPATINYPVTSGDAVWTESGAQAEIEVSSVHVAIAPTTEFETTTLNDTTFSTTLAQGESYLRVRGLPVGGEVDVATPRATVAITVDGRYGIVAGDAGHATTVTVAEGAAHLGGGSLSLNVGPHQMATVDGGDNFQGTIGPEQDDAFLAAQIARERPPAATAATTVATTRTTYQPPEVVRQMTGVDALLDTGEWAPSQDYGQVWYPPVQRDWRPYRDGHWAWVQPWGWTWVDDASWGFAPAHYGRWVQIDNRWGWSPLDPGAPATERPVYAPALVSFADVAAGVAVGAAVGLAAGAAIGWIPLGPREPYYPPYRASPGYLQRLNTPDVRDARALSPTDRPLSAFVNRGAATFAPRDAMVRSEPIAAHVQAIPQASLASIRPVREVPVRPTLATAGVTPSVARQLDLRAVPGQAAARPAPGPALEPPRLAASRPGAGVGVGTAAGVAAGAAALGGAAMLGRRGPTGLPPLAGAQRPGFPAAGAPIPAAAGVRPAVPGQSPAVGGVAPGLLAPGHAFPGAVRPEAARPPLLPVAPGAAGVPHPGAARPEDVRPGVPAPAATRPDSVRPGAPAPAVAHPEVARPESGRPESGRPESGRPESGRPDAARPGLAPPLAPRPQAARPEVARPEITRPAVPTPIAPPPTASRPQVARPEAARPQPAAPVPPRPEAARPQVAAPAAPRPEITRPQPAAPVAPRPEIARPQVVAPPAPRPEIARPQVVAPAAPRPEIARPQPAPSRPAAPAAPPQQHAARPAGPAHEEKRP